MSKLQGINSILAFSGNLIQLQRLEGSKVTSTTVNYKKNLSVKLPEPDNLIVDCLAFSPSGTNVAVCVQKEMLLYRLSDNDCHFQHSAPIEKKAVTVKFLNKSKVILVAEKCGIVAFYSFESGLLVKQLTILGHNSMLTDALVTPNDDYIITAERDEKIRVSHYPNTYNIQSYCLGHDQFVSSLQFLPSDESILVSASGDGTIRLWDFLNGKQLAAYKEEKSRPLMKCVCVLRGQLNIIAIQMYKHAEILLLSVTGVKNSFQINVENRIPTFSQVLDMCVFCCSLLYLLDDETPIRVMQVSENSIQYLDQMNGNLSSLAKYNPTPTFDLLFKREFNNVEMYHERKRLRIAEKIK